jgi:hypothetical protein
MSRTSSKTQTKPVAQHKAYEKPTIKTLSQRDVVKAVNKGSKFPARGFSG